MSSFLEFRQIAYKLPFDAPTAKWTEAAERYGIPNKGISGWGERTVYFVFVEGGDNNVIDENNRVARSWHVSAAGTWHDAFRHICHIAANYVHGGMVCFRSRAHWTKPENYIAKYREVMNSAQGMEELLGRVSLRFHLNRLPETLHPWQREMEEKGRLKPVEDNRYNLLISGDREEAFADLCWLATQCNHEGHPLFYLERHTSILW